MYYLDLYIDSALSLIQYLQPYYQVYQQLHANNSHNMGPIYLEARHKLTQYLYADHYQLIINFLIESPYSFTYCIRTFKTKIKELKLLKNKAIIQWKQIFHKIIINH